LNEAVSESAVVVGRGDPQAAADSRAASSEHRRAIRAAVRGRRRRDARRRRLLAIADLLAISLAALVPVSATGSPWAFAFLPLWILAAKLFGLYDRDHRALRHLTADEVPAIIAWAATITAGLALLLPLTPAESIGGGLAAGLHLTVAALAAVTLRSLARKLWWIRTPPETVGLIGDGPALESMRRKFGLFRDMHFELAVEHLVDDLGEGGERSDKLLGLADSVDRIVVAAGYIDTDMIAELNSICRKRQVKLSVVSPLRGKALPSLQIAQLADLPILEYSTWDASRSSLVLKRAFDFSASALSRLLLVPLLPVIAIAIKLDSRGPVFFSQVRAGLGGRPFRIYKFRTMAIDAESRLDQVVDLEQLDDPMFKLREDPRVTRVGRFLRRLSLDELPQLVNVLLGEMSVVGPRPEQIEIVDRYSPEDRFRLTVKPGITGPMQIFGRGELTFSERLAVELEYVENPSLSRDLRILLHTVPAVIRGTGAF
jgi:exopolysaccharide biosynthesis polyprenyl glycosylphosphotransferase